MKDASVTLSSSPSPPLSLMVTLECILPHHILRGRIQALWPWCRYSPESKDFASYWVGNRHT